MIKIVLDTNSLISATFWTGASFKILQLVDQGKLKLFISPEILKEYVEVLEYEEIIEKTSEKQRQAGLAVSQKLLLIATIVEPKIKLRVVKEDHDDDKILEVAVTAKADFIVTSDRHLLKLKKYEGVLIVKPEEFLAENK